jgi:hypothetical protein
VWQWDEALISGYYRGARGGSWGNTSDNLASSTRAPGDPPFATLNIGFRVAMVPEPSTIALLLASAACLLGYVRRRRTA